MSEKERESIAEEFFQTETRKHTRQVRDHLLSVVSLLQEAGWDHDSSKFGDAEAPLFAEYTPKLKDCTYGSPEYADFLKGLKPALDHHYAANRHHPEHHADGVKGMDLVDLVEMLCDWWAASERHDDGDIRKSIDINAKRFGYGPELQAILHNTIDRIEKHMEGGE